MSAVVLPSIREMFPEYLAQNHSRSTGKNHSKSTRASTSRLPDPTPNPSSIHAIPSVRHHRPTASTHSHAPMPHPPQSSSTPSSFQVQSGTRSSSSILSNSDSHSTKKRSNSDAMYYSFDILRSDPSSPSLQHIASSATYPNRTVHPASQSPHPSLSGGSIPAFRVAVASTSGIRQRLTDSRVPRGYAPSSDNHAESIRIDSNSGSGCSSFPAFGSAAVQSLHSGDISDSDDDELSASNHGKKHVCPTCFKRFNRPSSLKIHVNTHTGATPFRCPWPECGREFNVNSNMRRHYRNHTTPGSKSIDHRRRRRRGPANNLVDGHALYPIHNSRQVSSTDSPLMSSRSASEESDEDIPTPMDECDAEGSSEFSKERQYYQAFRHHSEFHTRTSSRTSPSRSASSSTSPSPPPSHVYIPSAPYIQSVLDKRVSTALRPAFHSALPVQMDKGAIKENP